MSRNVNLSDCDPFLLVGNLSTTVPYSYSESELLDFFKKSSDLVHRAEFPILTTT